MQRFRLVGCATALAILSSCGGGGGGGGGAPPQKPNGAPVLHRPAAITGSGGNFLFVLPIAGSQNLDFSATDPDSDFLHWRLGGDGTNVGAHFPAQAAGGALRITIDPVAATAAASVTIVVEDAVGNATAINLLIVRSGEPTLTGIAPRSCFAFKPQQVTISGGSLSLGGTASANVAFDAQVATDVTVQNDTTLHCTTPATLPSGPSSVSITNQYGTASLPSSAFTALPFPPQFAAADQALDGGAGDDLALAQDGDAVHAVWIENGALMHRPSSDGGSTWNASQTLSGGELPSNPQLAVAGTHVSVAWIGNGTSVIVRNSSDGGASFDPAVIINPAAGSLPATRLQLRGAADRRCAAWLAGDPAFNASRVMVSSSTDAGVTWVAPTFLDNGPANQSDQTLACSGDNAWMVFLDARQTGGVRGVYTSRSTDGGLTWSAASRRSAANTLTSEPRMCTAAGHVHITWLQAGTLRYMVSDNGLIWPSSATELQDLGNGTITEPVVACDGPSFFAAYIAGGNAVWVTRVLSSGGIAQHVQVSTAAVTAASPQLVNIGNYVFAAWRSDVVGTGAARILQAVSANAGTTFAGPAGFGDGTAAQEKPCLLVDGARIVLGWLDHRGATAALFTNRN